jgi:hypothetical protein
VKNGVKFLQTTGYNGARMVFKWKFTRKFTKAQTSTYHYRWVIIIYLRYLRGNLPENLCTKVQIDLDIEILNSSLEYR